MGAAKVQKVKLTNKQKVAKVKEEIKLLKADYKVLSADLKVQDKILNALKKLQLKRDLSKDEQKTKTAAYKLGSKVFAKMEKINGKLFKLAGKVEDLRAADMKK